MKIFIKSLLVSLIALFCVSSIVFAYTVIPGDYLAKIAQNANISLSELLQLNPQVENPDLIHPGEEINTGLLGGGGGLPITDYETTLSQPLTSSATTINVASITTTDSHTITAADFTPAIYFIVDPNNDAKKEIVKCTGVSGVAFTGCTRGLAFYGTTETSVSANQKSHGAGVQIVNSNVHYYYVSLNTDQTWAGIQTFDVYPVASSTIGLPTTAYQFATKTYVDSVGAGGFTASNIGGGLTLRANGTSPETMDINTSTYPLWFDIDSSGYFGLATTTIYNHNTAVLGLKDFGDYYFASSTNDRYISNSTSTEDVSGYLFNNQYIYTRGASSWATTTPTDLMSVWNTASSTWMIYDSSAFDWNENDSYNDTGYATGTGLDDWFNDRTNATTTKALDFTFSDDLTVSGDLIVTNDLIVNGLVNKFTSGETIAGATTPIPVFVATTTKIMISDGDDNLRYDFIGFAISTANLDEDIYIQTNGVVSGFTGLTIGSEYFVQDAIGTIDTTIGTYPYLTGIAISATELLITDNDIAYPSSNLRISSVAQADADSKTYVKVKEITILKSGIYTIDFGLWGPGGGHPVFGRIYKDGVAFGTEQTSESATEINKSEDLTFYKGEKCQLYAHEANTADEDAHIANFKFYYDAYSPVVKNLE